MKQQVAWLHQAHQEREKVITELRTEVLDQRNEIANLRSQTFKVAFLEEQMAGLFGGAQHGYVMPSPPAAVSNNKGKEAVTRYATQEQTLHANLTLS